MDWHLAIKLKLVNFSATLLIRSAQFASVNEYSLYAALILSIITSKSVANSKLHAERCSFYSLIRSELVASVNSALRGKVSTPFIVKKIHGQ